MKKLQISSKYGCFSIYELCCEIVIEKLQLMTCFLYNLNRGKILDDRGDKPEYHETTTKSI